MKKSLLSLILIFMFAFSTKAQSIKAQDVSDSAEKRIALITRVMTAELGLNESEYIRLKALNRERIVKGDEIAEYYSNNPDIKAAKLQELENNFDKKFRNMLNPSQLAAYSAYKHDPETNLALKEKHNTANNQPKK
ncbi:MAG: hypothetical protein JWQ14_2126 [Adhaeribacter sp.]|nr:hypothetical protein [Adhaeribacter sp.]